MRAALWPALVLAVVEFACGGGGGGAKGPGGKGGGSVYQQVTMRVMHRMGDGKDVEVASAKASLAELAGKPIVVSIFAAKEELAPAGDVEDTSATSSLGGGLGGGLAGAPDAGPPPGVIIDTRLSLGDQVGEPAVVVSKCERPDTCVQREWLAFELSGKGVAPRTVERVLFDAPATGEPPPVLRRFVVSVIDGPVAEADINRAEAALSARLDKDRARLDAIRAETGKVDEVARAAELHRLNPAGALGLLVHMQFAAESDALSARLAASMGVEISRPVPRILVTTFSQKTADAVELSLDLRLDEVETRGDAARAYNFQYARGLSDGELEGTVLTKLAGKPAVTTGKLHRLAVEAGIAVVGLNGTAPLPAGLPPHDAERVQIALAAGHHVIIPDHAVSVDGVARWGWWDLDPASGRIVGVMEGGQHQASLERAITEHSSKQKRLGFVIGFLIGADYALFELSASAIKAGPGMTDEQFAEIEQDLADRVCLLCPFAKADAKLKIGLGDSCVDMDHEQIAGHLTGEPKKAKNKAMDFCKGYQDGFKCAVGLVLWQSGGQSTGMTVSRKAEVKLGCNEAKTECKAVAGGSSGCKSSWSVGNLSGSM